MQNNSIRGKVMNDILKRSPKKLRREKFMEIFVRAVATNDRALAKKMHPYADDMVKKSHRAIKFFNTITDTKTPSI